ncbi:XRE family transcriptional regulator [Butyrivibrio sp. CB08]|uniref:helix-turn-helix domain-containing protein n=1 Tax=Butyrivibrio sp. CB08 TaxID=2364879 RepID=UPI000EA939CF|nr:helix-turn-helix transcriptional regulator [Butyrivibrio sp. CB08]RKM61971.1 XRE family transcriptional regulator [Butyrivibrio sp. CB08]
MILADKIINERKKLGWSQEELADKLDVSRQSVSKWESAQSTPDLGRILKMAELFGVTTDYLLKDEIEEVSTSVIVQDSGESAGGSRRFVSMEESSTYLNVVEKTTPNIANAVSMCILSPALLIALAGLSSTRFVSEMVAVGVGITVLLLMVAVAVFMFILNGRYLEPYEFLESVDIDTAYGVDGMVKEKKARFEKKHTLFIAIGVVLCILSALPLIVTSLFVSTTRNGAIITAMVAVLLIMVAVGVNMIIRVSSIMGSYNKLLQEGDYNTEGKRANKTVSRVAGIYWPVVLAGYLAWSFITNGWAVTWIVWPIAAVLFGAVAAIARSFSRE